MKNNKKNKASRIVQKPIKKKTTSPTTNGFVVDKPSTSRLSSAVEIQSGKNNLTVLGNTVAVKIPIAQLNGQSPYGIMAMGIMVGFEQLGIKNIDITIREVNGVIEIIMEK